MGSNFYSHLQQTLHAETVKLFLPDDSLSPNRPSFWAGCLYTHLSHWSSKTLTSYALLIQSRFVDLHPGLWCRPSGHLWTWPLWIQDLFLDESSIYIYLYIVNIFSTLLSLKNKHCDVIVKSDPSRVLKMDGHWQLWLSKTHYARMNLCPALNPNIWRERLHLVMGADDDLSYYLLYKQSVSFPVQLLKF